MRSSRTAIAWLLLSFATIQMSLGAPGPRLAPRPHIEPFRPKPREFKPIERLPNHDARTHFLDPTRTDRDYLSQWLPKPLSEEEIKQLPATVGPRLTEDLDRIWAGYHPDAALDARLKEALLEDTAFLQDYFQATKIRRY